MRQRKVGLGRHTLAARAHVGPEAESHMPEWPRPAGGSAQDHLFIRPVTYLQEPVRLGSAIIGWVEVELEQKLPLGGTSDQRRRHTTVKSHGNGYEGWLACLARDRRSILEELGLLPLTQGLLYLAQPWHPIFGSQRAKRCHSHDVPQRIRKVQRK